MESVEIEFGGGVDSSLGSGSAYNIGGYSPTTPRKETYQWRAAGFGPCSATCLGHHHVQHSSLKREIIHTYICCVHDIVVH